MRIFTAPVVTFSNSSPRHLLAGFVIRDMGEQRRAA
jgi:hypothetical protein